MDTRISNFNKLILVAFISVIMASCAKDSDETIINSQVSGIFKGDTLYLNDSVVATVFFSFDELEDGTINGGVRVLIDGNKQNYQRQKYRSFYSIGNWIKTSDSITVVSGEADMGEELGSITFSGSINGNNTFDYIFSGYGFTDEGRADFIGEFIRQTNTKNYNTTNYVGTYSVACGAAPPNPQNEGGCDAFNISLNITAQAPDGYGGIAITGYFSGDIPYLGSNNHVLMDDQSEIYGGYLSTATDNNNFYFGCNTCPWDPSTNYSCDYGYCIYTYPYGWVVTVQSSVNMSPAQ